MAVGLFWIIEFVVRQPRGLLVVCAYRLVIVSERSVPSIYTQRSVVSCSKPSLLLRLCDFGAFALKSRLFQNFPTFPLPSVLKYAIHIECKSAKADHRQTACAEAGEGRISREKGNL